TYTKPLLQTDDQPPRELNRLDIKNRSHLPIQAEEGVLKALDQAWKQVDALVVSDQVSEADCGVVAEKVRERLAEMGEAKPDKVILADSRERIRSFRSLWLKPNEIECRRAIQDAANRDLPSCVQELAKRAGRPVCCSRGD